MFRHPVSFVRPRRGLIGRGAGFAAPVLIGGMFVAGAAHAQCTPSWSSPAGGMDITVRALCNPGVAPGLWGPAIYAGGGFVQAGGVPMNRIARWDQSSWTPLGIGVPYQYAYVEAIQPYAAGPGQDPWLYVGGFLPSAGGIATHGIARFRLGLWSDAGGGVGPPNAVEVLSLREYDEDGPGPKAPSLFAGGSQDSAGGVPVMGLARWNGQTWSAVQPFLGAVAGYFPAVYALEVYDDDGPGPRREGLYVAGTMNSAGGVSAWGVARWDGQSWEGLAGPGQFPGIGGTPVESLGVFDPDGPGPQREGLYVGGFYSSAGGITVWGLARWDGVWSAVPGWTGGGVQAMAVFDDDGPGPNRPALFVGGGINQVNGLPASGIVKWDGQQWSTLAGGVTGFGEGTSIRAMAAFDEDGPGPNPGGLYAGGFFFNAAGGQLYSPGLARWGCPLPPECYANCTRDLSPTTGGHVLSVFDFGCFQTRYVLGDPYADCNQDGQLTVADFGCFQTRFVAGCP